MLMLFTRFTRQRAVEAFNKLKIRLAIDFTNREAS